MSQKDASPLANIARSVGARVEQRSIRFAAVTGTVALLRGVRALRNGDRRRAATRFLFAAAWFAVAFAGRQSASRDTGRSDAEGVDQTDVVRTSPNVDDVERADRPQASGEEGDPADVVDTATVDIEESDTAPEIESDVEATDVDQTDVVDTGVGANDLDGSERDS